ncbi:MAG: response regulator [Gammaproteobacteria bacterium]|nr:response regulator [Gammaproteobacteria bacterium]
MAHTVLIVDDSPTELHVLGEGLRKHGYEVLTAENGEDGLELCRRHRPDAVLMDIVLPGISGFEATRKITRDPETKGTPVIIVSGKNLDTDRLWGLRQGAVGYLAKPIDEDHLVETIRECIDSREPAGA